MTCGSLAMPGSLKITAEGLNVPPQDIIKIK